jgi:hypothetical protein
MNGPWMAYGIIRGFTRMGILIVCLWVLVWQARVRQGLVRVVWLREDVVGQVAAGWGVVVQVFFTSWIWL